MELILIENEMLFLLLMKSGFHFPKDALRGRFFDESIGIIGLAVDGKVS
ncbi:hypothetical protein [Huaxiibacter chinensis]